MGTLLDRDTFREGVFDRDGHKCVICGEPAQDAHHIMERKLFPDGGYYLNNGASLCGKHHLEAEMTTLSVEDVRSAAKIPESKKVLPPAFYEDQRYDKWGNPILANGLRMRGELFDDVNVQRILEQGNVLNKFTKYVKYPRTWHLPWSPGKSKDDRVLTTPEVFAGQEVVVTVKMDGENCLDGEILITTRSGPVSVKELCHRDDVFEVLSFNHETGQQEWKRVEAKRILPPSGDWYEIELENGQSIRLTGEHRIWCENLNCYRMVKDLDGSEELRMEDSK